MNSVKQISPKKFWRMLELGERCVSFTFDNRTWKTNTIYTSFKYKGYLYTQERSKSKNFGMIYKRYPVPYNNGDISLVVSGLKKTSLY